MEKFLMPDREFLNPQQSIAILGNLPHIFNPIFRTWVRRIILGNYLAV